MCYILDLTIFSNLRHLYICIANMELQILSQEFLLISIFLTSIIKTQMCNVYQILAENINN